MTRYSPLEFAYAALALVMLALFVASFFDAESVRIRKLRRDRAVLPAMRAAPLRRNRRRGVS